MASSGGDIERLEVATGAADLFGLLRHGNQIFRRLRIMALAAPTL
jgi:hypothetical protein